MKYTAEQKDGVITVRFSSMSSSDIVWLLLRSDAHHDSPYCNRKLEKAHLELAKERKAIILDAGDTFDAMQGKFDPRRTMEDVREEDRTADYYGSIVTHAAEDYLPYAKNWLMFGKGNHETAVLDKANTDLISNLVYRMNAEAKTGILAGGYKGYVKLMFTSHKTKKQSLNIRYHHGNGGAAPVTRGTIQTNRQQVFLPDADVVWNGHNHQSYVLPIPRERISQQGKIYHDVCWHVRTPGYKDERDRTEGWSTERNSGPTPLGCCWLEFRLEKGRIKMKAYQDIE